MQGLYCLLLFLVFPFVIKAQCPNGPYFINDQIQIDEFALNYPNCLDADIIFINGSSVTDLSGLSQLNSLNYLAINDNNNLTSLVGLGGVLIKRSFVLNNNEDLISIDGVEFNSNINWVSLNNNPVLENLDALSVVTDISGNGLGINGPINITNFNVFSGLESANNIFLVAIETITSLDGFSSLLNVGNLTIAHNSNLTSIEGISNLQSIEKLEISYNSTLSYCNIQPVCDAIENNHWDVIILTNAVGCNTKQEVADACGVVLDVSKFELNNSIIIYPNPVFSMLQIETSNTLLFEKVTIYSTLGKLIFESSEKQINLENLSAGIYFVEVITDKGVVTKKIVKQ